MRKADQCYNEPYQIERAKEKKERLTVKPHGGAHWLICTWCGVYSKVHLYLALRGPACVNCVAEDDK